jgi:hypothetical protein
MSLDGLRAWIGVVERKLTMRTRVFLVLVALAVGGAGAAIYLAVEAQNESVSKSDLEAVRDEAAGTTAAPSGGADTAQLESELQALRSEVAALRDGESSGDKSKTGGAGETSNGAKEADGGTGGDNPSGGASVPKSQKQLKELVEQAQEQAGK